MSETEKYNWISDPDPDLTKLHDAKMRYERATVEREKALEKYHFACIDWEDAATNYELEIRSYASNKGTGI